MLSIRVPIMQVLCWNRFLCVQVPKSGADASAVFWCTAWNSPGHSTAILPFEGWTGNSITFEWSTATERIMEAKRTCTEIQRPWSWFCLWSILSVFQCPFVLENSSHIFDLADSCINVGLHIGKFTRYCYRQAKLQERDLAGDGECHTEPRQNDTKYGQQHSNKMNREEVRFVLLHIVGKVVSGWKRRISTKSNANTISQSVLLVQSGCTGMEKAQGAKMLQHPFREAPYDPKWMNACETPGCRSATTEAVHLVRKQCRRNMTCPTKNLQARSLKSLARLNKRPLEFGVVCSKWWCNQFACVALLLVVGLLFSEGS